MPFASTAPEAHALGRFLAGISVTHPQAAEAMWDAAQKHYAALPGGVGVSDSLWASFVTGWNIGRDEALYGIKAREIDEISQLLRPIGDDQA